MSNNEYYIYSDKKEIFRQISPETLYENKFDPNLQEQTAFRKYFPLSSSIDIQYYAPDNYQRSKLIALENALNFSAVKNINYKYDERYGIDTELTLISIPSMFFGSSIEKGSVELSFHYSGTLVAKLQDCTLDGSLKETTGSNVGSVAGVVLYNHGFILLTGGWDLHNGHKWCQYAYNSSDDVYNSGSYDLKFNGTSYIPSLTMMAHAKKNDLTYSNNPTFIKHGQSQAPLRSKTSYKEPETLEIKNVEQYPYSNYTGSLQKQTFITKIGIFDENERLIAIAKLSTPIRKTQDRDYTFKLKLDI